MDDVVISLRDGFAVDRAQECLAHAIAIVNNDWQAAQKMATDEMRSAWTVGVACGLRGNRLAQHVIGALDISRERLPV